MPPPRPRGVIPSRPRGRDAALPSDPGYTWLVTAPRPICFLSDYGYEDDFAGTCRGIIARFAPDVRVIDVTHGIARHDLLGAAFVLRNTARYMPDGAVHLAVVDPGVGGPRRAIVLRSAHDRFFVGPDNGMLVLAAEADGGIAGAWEIANEELFLKPLSATFHGRDIFAPVAAHLANGVAFADLGRAIHDPVRLSLPKPEKTLTGWRAHVTVVDAFGNLTTDLPAAFLPEKEAKEKVLFRLGDFEVGGVVVSYGSKVPGDLIALVDSENYIEIAVVNGSAAQTTGARVGDFVEVIQ